MAKKKILLIRIKGENGCRICDEVGSDIKEKIERFGMIVYDDRIEIKEVEVDGIYWENSNGSL